MLAMSKRLKTQFKNQKFCFPQPKMKKPIMDLACILEEMTKELKIIVSQVKTIIMVVTIHILAMMTMNRAMKHLIPMKKRIFKERQRRNNKKDTPL